MIESERSLVMTKTSPQIRNLNEERHVRITDAGARIAIALNMSVDLSRECLASVTALELVNGSWSCIKSCYTIDNLIRRAACLKNCEDKDPNQE